MDLQIQLLILLISMVWQLLFEFKEAAASTYLSLDDATGKVTFTAEGKSHHFYEAVTYTVEVKATSKWGTIKNYEGKNTITVTIPAE